MFASALHSLFPVAVGSFLVEEQTGWAGMLVRYTVRAVVEFVTSLQIVLFN